MQTSMAATMQEAAGRRDWRLWAGRVLSGLVVLFLLLDGAMKLVPIAPVTDTAGQLGWTTDPGTWRVLGLVLIASTLLYAAPRPSVLGAVLITAYLGGAVATHADRQPAPQPHPLRRLPRRDRLGRAVAARP